MKDNFTQPLERSKISAGLELPKFSSKYSFFYNRKEGSKRNFQEQTKESKVKDKQVTPLSLKFNRHRYAQASPLSETPQQLRKFRNSENLCARRNNKSHKSGESEIHLGRLQNPPIKRFLSISTKSVRKNSRINQSETSSNRKQPQAKQFKSESNSVSRLKSKKPLQYRSNYLSSKKIRDSRLRKERKSQILSIKQPISRLGKRSSTPKQTPFQEEKVNEIEEIMPLIEPSYLILVQNVLANICEAIRSESGSVYELSLCYITLERQDQEKHIHNLFKDQSHASMIRSFLVLQRLCIYFTLYINKNKPIKKSKQENIWQLVVNTFKSHSVCTDLILEMLVDLKKIDSKQFPIKEIGKEKKTKQIFKYINQLRKKLSSILENSEDKILQLINHLFVSSLKIDSLQYIDIIDRTLKWEILKLPSYPYLPPSVKPYSLVLDLDETLIHFDTKTMELMIRPYAQQFILRMSKLFQIIIFTAGTKQYADDLIDQIDPTHCVSFRLYRNHINIHEGLPVKDLSMLGRNLKNTIIVDNLITNFKLQPSNGILISTWEGDIQDLSLSKLEYVLKNIVKLYPDNFPQGIKRWSTYIKQNIAYTPLIFQLQKDF